MFSNPNFLDIKESSQFKSEKTKKIFKKSKTWKDLRKTASHFASSTATCVHWENSIWLCTPFPDFVIPADQTALLWQWGSENCLFCNVSALGKKRKNLPPSLNIDSGIWLFLFTDPMIILPMRSSNKLSQMYTNCRDAEEENYLKAWNYRFPGVCQQLQMEAQQKRDAWRSLSTHAILHPAYAAFSLSLSKQSLNCPFCQ